MNNPHPLLFTDLIRQALIDDLGSAGDVTTDAIVSPEVKVKAVIVARKAGRVCGIEMARVALQLLDQSMTVTIDHADGDDVAAGEPIAQLQGQARAILSAERTALNILARLSGIATATRDTVASINAFPAKIVCTRKTTPGLRALEKYAVRVGGGSNHRFGLYDAVLIKDNHRVLAGGISESVQRVRQSVGHMVKIEVEVDTLAELEQALALGVDLLLLDNMSPTTLKQAVTMAHGKAITEASGGINPDNIQAIAATGVDLISLGWLTHSAPALDVALDLMP